MERPLKNSGRKGVRHGIIPVSHIVLFILLNILILGMTLSLCFLYTSREKERYMEREKQAFSVASSSVEMTAFGFLEKQQESCNDLAKYINSVSFTIDEALDYVRNACSNTDVMVHIIKVSDKSGVSSVPDRNGNDKISYARITSFDFSTINMLINDEVELPINIARTYSNPVNGMDVVGFFNIIDIADGNGGIEKYYIIRVVPVEILVEKWGFPVEFEKAEMSLIHSSGEFIMRSPSLKNQNFWEYIRIYNNLDYSEAEKLSKYYMENDGVIEGVNAEHGAALFTCRNNTRQKEWYFVCYIPVDAMASFSYDWRPAIVVGAVLLSVIVIDTICFWIINRRLKETAEHLEKISKAKTQFLSSMSHDIRTPMNAIIGMTTIATKSMGNPERVKECLAKISSASNHLLTLINDILDISKIESGKVSLNSMPFSVADLFSNVVDIMRSGVKEKDIEFLTSAKGIREEYLVADELRLNQILINLLSNAVKYTANGGRIAFTMEEKEREDGKTGLVFTVEDNGIGMTEEFQKVMYDSFARANDSRIDKIQGSGLGLTITKQMVNLFGGTIECVSRPGEGTKFTVSLAFVAAEREEEAYEIPETDALVVEDGEKNAAVIGSVLSSMGFNVTLAPGRKEFDAFVASLEGRSALVILPTVLTDGTSGVDVSVSAYAANSSLKIFVTGDDWSDSIYRDAGDAIACFLQKPLFPSILKKRIADIYDESGGAESGGAESGGAESGGANSPFQGLRLLVAEDNDLNWEIIEMLLEMYGISTARAEDGRICVDMLDKASEGDYDLVLMDVQMPNMNGYEAARAIRGLGTEWKRNIPVIAMTADAFAEDVMACLEAGMNGHVAKPIDLHKLFAEMDKTGVMKKRAGCA